MSYCRLCKCLLPILDISPEFIIEKSSEFFKVDKAKLLSKARNRRLVEYRYMIAHILYNNPYSRLTLYEIAEYLGKRDHSTIIHGLSTIKNLCEVDENLRQKMLSLYILIYGDDKLFNL